MDCDGLVAPIPVLPLFLRYWYNLLSRDGRVFQLLVFLPIFQATVHHHQRLRDPYQSVDLCERADDGCLCGYGYRLFD